MSKDKAGAPSAFYFDADEDEEELLLLLLSTFHRVTLDAPSRRTGVVCLGSGRAMGGTAWSPAPVRAREDDEEDELELELELDAVVSAGPSV